MSNQNSLNAFVDEFLRRKLPNVDIHEVRVEHGDASDGESVLLVTVVFSVESLESDRVPVSRLTRNLLSELVERKNDAFFPIFSFRNQNEDARLNAAA